ncbi:uncharacterized protein LOC130815888 [Amaranthus tricolor]|uniref:uncharacterized protein LOC130815888 n=1 Tax=Amaranthus tricolor TaxID=29722 RepID=UPI0025837D12|nr:uncharacterized protein LOC130815888 [Amaranthus tricolor]
MPGSTWKGRNYNFDIADPSKPVLTFRSRKPSHFIFEIDSYDKLESALTAANLDVFETPQFAAGGVEWALRIYPNGNKARGGDQHVSLYLTRKKDPVNRPSEVTVTIKFFIQDQLSGEYLVIEDLGERSFDVRDAEWGIPKAIKTDDFKLPSNGFLVNHKCTFGAEVYITSGEPKYSQISVVKNIPKRIYDVTFDLTPPRSEPLESETFTTRFDGEDYTWKLVLYRDGYEEGSSTHHSLYMKLLDKNKLSGGKSMLVNFNLRILNNVKGDYEHGRNAVLDWYNYNKDTAGYPTFMPSGYLFSRRYKYVEDNNASVQVTFNSVFLSHLL